MSKRDTTNKAMTKEEVIAAINQLARRLGRPPSLKELLRATKVTKHAIRMTFLTYRDALAACGLSGLGYRLALRELFQDWAGVARKVGKIPTITEYGKHGKHSYAPLLKQFGSWLQVPAGLLHYAREHKLEAEWKDVMELLSRHAQPAPGFCNVPARTKQPASKPRILPDQPIYGAPFWNAPLAMAPTNENGVIFLFGAMARDLGFMMLRLQTGFPDGEAFREVEPGRWQRVRIEFEYESRNFLKHSHPITGCDVIVCWKNNWPDCPLEVIELSKEFARIGGMGIAE